MTFTVNPWWVVAVLSLALFGVVWWWQWTRDAAWDARAWWRDRRDARESGVPVSGFRRLRAWGRDRREPGKDDGGMPWCEECDGWHRWSHEDYPEAPRSPEWLPPERSQEELGFTEAGGAGSSPAWVPGCGPVFPGVSVDSTPSRLSATFLQRLEARRERLASAAELEHRAAYEAMGLEYPSGLLARVREAAP